MNSDFQAFLQQRAHLSVSTKQCERRWMRDYQAFLDSEGLVWQATTTAIFERYHQSLLWKTTITGRLYSANTVDQALRTLRTFFRWTLAQKLTRQPVPAGFALPQPTTPEPVILTRAQVLALLQLPDTNTAKGMRDALILELLYAFPLTTGQCERLRLDQVVDRQLVFVEKTYPLHDTWPAMERYLEAGRPCLARDDTPTLLLGAHGTAFTSIDKVLHHYGFQLGLPQLLNARILRHSYRDHIAALARRSTF
jgi:integrase/recombinase XerD